MTARTHKAMDHAAYVRRETVVSMGINAVFSLLFFFAFFAGVNPVPLWGFFNLVVDIAPQSFMIALMSTLVPGHMTSKKIRAGILVADGPHSRLPGGPLARALLLAVISAVLGTSVMAGLAYLSGLSELPAAPAATIKIIYGVVLASIVTPPGLRAALARDRWIEGARS